MRKDAEFKEVNKCFFWLFILIINLTGVLLGYAMAYNNQVETCMNVKFGWESIADQNKFQAYLGCVVVLGMTIGAVCGGILMKIGRRRALILASLLGVIGIGLTMKLDFTFLMIGRFIYGFSVGLYSSIVPRFIEEESPSHLYDQVAPTYCFSQTVGTICAYFLGAILPADDDTEALLETNRWLVIYAYFPLALYFLTIISFIFIVKYEPVKYSIK